MLRMPRACPAATSQSMHAGVRACTSPTARCAPRRVYVLWPSLMDHVPAWLRKGYDQQDDMKDVLECQYVPPLNLTPSFDFDWAPVCCVLCCTPSPLLPSLSLYLAGDRHLLQVVLHGCTGACMRGTLTHTLS
jgi:hypothetical protein